MSLGTDLTFIEKYHRDIIWILLAGLAVFGTIYIKDRLHNETITKENAQIASLNIEAVKLTAAKDTADAAATSVYNLYQLEHSKVVALLSKKPVITPTPTVSNAVVAPAPLVQLPNTPTPTTLPDCQQELAAVKADDAQCVDTVNDLQTDKAADQALINNQSQTIFNVDVENTQLKKDVNVQTKRKKLWRDSALAEAALIALHFLL
jgi:hypothetical protein